MTGASEIIVRNIIFANKYIAARNVSSIYCRNKVNLLANFRYCSTTTSKDAADPAPVFFKDNVQNLLKSLTRPEPKQVFRKKKDGRRLLPPKYMFMTDEQLAKSRKKADQKMAELLQMPPMLQVKEDDKEILSKDPEIQGHNESNIVFTDITYGLKNKDRLIVVREPNGTLRMANNDERKRMIQICFPLPGREIFPPKMFSGEYFEDLLKRHEYEYILNKAVVQYEPNESEWLRICHQVYDHVNQEETYHKLLSTRFYGPMVFYYAWNKNIDKLLIKYLSEKKITDATWLIQLYQIIHPDCQSAKMKCDGNELDFILQYAENDAKDKSRLIMAIKVYKEFMKAQEELEQNVKKAHGIE